MTWPQALGWLVVGVGINLYHAWSITVLWGWSLVTLGLPQIGLAPAMALDGMVAVMKLRQIRQDEAEWDPEKTVGLHIVGPAMILGLVGLVRWVAGIR